jgi:hypothetical protein
MAATVVAAAGGEPSIDAKLRVTDRSIEAGKRTGLIVRNTGKRRIVYGLGAQRIERREAGRWVNAFGDVCPDGCPILDVGLSLRPGEAGGPRYAGKRDYVRFPRSVEPGRYRLTKEIRNYAHPRRGRERIREVVRVREP